MLLTCHQCHNTYVVDDNLFYNQQGNILCEQCNIVLSSPPQNGMEQNQQSWDQNQQSWDQNQQSWDQNQQSWDQNQQSWGQNQQSWDQNQQSWDQNQQSWGQNQQSWDQNQQSWGQNQQSWDQNQQSWDQNQQSWNQNQQSWDQNQQSWNQNQQSWNQNQQSWDQNQQSWGQNQQSWDQNQQSWDQNQQGWEQNPPNDGLQVDNNQKIDRTMALDLDAMLPGDQRKSLQGALASVDQGASAASWGEQAWGETKNEGVQGWGESDPWGAQAPPLGGAREPSPAPGPGASSTSHPSVVLGQQSPQINVNKTQYLDLGALRSQSRMYARESGFVERLKELFLNIPPVARLIAGIVLVLCIVGLTVIIIVKMVSAPDDREKSDSDEAQVQEVEEKPKSFRDVIVSAKSKVPSLPVIEDADLNMGSVLAISESQGVLYNDKAVLKFGQLNTDKPYIPELGELIKDDPRVEFVILMAESIDMDIVYRVMYTIGAHNKVIYLGGSTATGISGVLVEPYNWPDFGDYQFPKYPNVEVKLTVGRSEVTLTKIAGSTPLITNDDGTQAINEVNQEILGGKYVFTDLVPAFAKLKVSRVPYLIILSRGNVSLGNFVKTMLFARGDVANPNVEHLLMAAVPLR